MRHITLLLAAVAATACGPAEPASDSEASAVAETAAALSPNEQNAVLEVANTASFEALDVDAGLDVRAANNIVTHRDGDDGVLGTADDRLYDSIAALDAIAYVGPSALDKLLAYAEQLGLVEEEEVSDAAILEVANTASFEVLDVDVGLDVRAAENIVAQRQIDPFDTIAELDAVPYVGDSALAKLAAYAAAHGEPQAPCLLISEYVEGAGVYNKAIEIFNCGSAPVPLDDVAICLVRNSDTHCTVVGRAGQTVLAPGDVWVTCRKKSNTFNDPYPLLAAACDHETSAMTFDGNDRLLLFVDENGDDAFDASVDVALDGFGAMSQVPGWWWEDKVFRRCNLEPFDGVHATQFYAKDYFTEHGRYEMQHLGTPPTSGCP